MKKHKEEIFVRAQMLIRGHVIRVENQTVNISYISRLWVEALPKKGLLTKNLVQAENYGLYFELFSGKLLAFISDNSDFVKKVYELISTMVAENNYISDYDVSFQGKGAVINNLEVEAEGGIAEKDDKHVLTEKSGNTKGQLGMELQLLYISWEEKCPEEASLPMSLHAAENRYGAEYKYSGESDTRNVILELIGQAIQQAEEEDKEGLRESFQRFIELGLIDDCNQLGLNLLLQKIKEYVFDIT